MAAPAALPPPTDDASSVASSAMPPFSRQAKISVAVCWIMSFLSTLGYMAFLPTLIFYIREIDGTEADYGRVMAACSFASFPTIPLYASWADTTGKYRAAWFFGQSLCIAGMLLYTLAIAFGETRLAVHVLLVSRILYGIGSGSGSISFAYIASVVEPEQLAYVTMLFSIAAGQGLAWGPFLNGFLEEVDFELSVPGLGGVPVNNINGVGLLIASTLVVDLVLIYFFLPDLECKQKAAAPNGKASADTGGASAGWIQVFAELGTDVKLFLPVFAAFAAQANYQMVELSFAPVTSHALGWGPTETSAVFGYNTILMGVVMVVAMRLSSEHGNSDTSMIICGESFSLIAGLMIFGMWTYPAEAWQLVTPFSVYMLGSPLIGPAITSLFTRAVMTRPSLEPIQARLQAVLTMAGTVADSLTPLFVGAFVLRSPEEVEAGPSHRELTHWSLYVPVLSGICIAGFLYEKFVLHVEDDEDDEEEEDAPATSGSALLTVLKAKNKFKKNLRMSSTSMETTLSAKNEANIHKTASIMGGNQLFPVYVPFETNYQKKVHQEAIQAKKELLQGPNGTTDDTGKTYNSIV